MSLWHVHLRQSTDADFNGQNMTRAMASHHAGDGIRVNAVCPGMVYTPMMYGAGMSEEARESRKNRSLLKTEGTAWDVAAGIRFLAGRAILAD